MKVSAVLVTRGDVDMTPVLESLAWCDETIVWDNSKLPDSMVFGRYLAAKQARNELCFSQDDDCVVPRGRELVEAYEDGLLVNVPEGEHPWLAWGAVFQRDLPDMAFGRYARGVGIEEAMLLPDRFLRWPDVIFASLTPWSRLDLGHQDLPWATAPNRMFFQPDHYASQAAMRERCAQL